MTSLFQILIELNLIVILLSVLYFSVRNKLAYGLRRLLITGIPILASAVLILKKMLVTVVNPTDLAMIELDLITLSDTSTEIISSVWSANTFYWVGVGVFAIWFTIKVLRVLYFFRTSKKNESMGVNILETPDKDSFSFFNFIHLSANLDETEKQVVLDHELVHVNKKHTLDLVIMEVYHSLFWFNPLFLLLKKELVYVHEFEVDQMMYGRYENEYIKHLLAHSLGSNSAQLLLTSQFYNGLSLTKRTKKMKSKANNNNLLFFLVPLLAGAFVFISWSSIVDPNDLTYSIEALEQEGEKVYEKVDKMPEFKGGQEAMVKYLISEIKYPEAAKKDNIQGTVYVGFIIRKTGQVEDSKVLKTVNELLDQEALRVIDAMPDWIPGEKDGKKVDVRYTIPIRFQL